MLKYLFRSVLEKTYCGATYKHTHHEQMDAGEKVFNFCTPFREPRVSTKQWEIKMLMRILNQQRRRWKRKKFQSHLFGESFSSYGGALIAVEIVFIIDNSKRRHKTEEKFAIHEIQQLFVFFSCWLFLLLFLERNSISIIGEKKREKYLNKVVSWMGTPMEICIQKGY